VERTNGYVGRNKRRLSIPTLQLWDKKNERTNTPEQAYLGVIEEILLPAGSASSTHTRPATRPRSLYNSTPRARSAAETLKSPRIFLGKRMTV